MNTKLIQFCEMELGEHPTEYYDKYFNRIIKALQRGEKYEKMWEKFGEEFKGIAVYGTGIFIKKGMDRYEQKYFPKEVKNE